MIPKSASWSYQRVENDIESGTYNGVAITLNYTSEEININNWIPKECDNFMMYILIIFRQENQTIILGAIKTPSNIFEDDTIPPNSYYGYYLVPSNYEVVTNSLRIVDRDNTELFIEMNYLNILNKVQLNYLSLPNNIIKFN